MIQWCKKLLLLYTLNKHKYSINSKHGRVPWCRTRSRINVESRARAEAATALALAKIELADKSKQIAINAEEIASSTTIQTLTDAAIKAREEAVKHREEANNAQNTADRAWKSYYQASDNVRNVENGGEY